MNKGLSTSLVFLLPLFFQVSWCSQSAKRSAFIQIPEKFEDFVCTEEDGFYAIPGECTGSYYACVGGVRYDQQCPANQIFDPEVLECVNEDEASCSVRTEAPFECQGDGFFPIDPEICSASYVYCLGGTSFPLECPGEAVFNPFTGDCRDDCLEPPTEPTTEEITTTEEPTNTPTTGRSTTPDPNGFECPPDVAPTEYPYPGNCSLYYFCFDDGSFEVGQCPPGLAFDPRSHYCKAPNSVPGCQLFYDYLEEPVNNAPGIINRAASKDLNSGVSDFECPEGVTIHEHSDCDKYYTCYGSEPTYLKQCGGGLLFDLVYYGCNYPYLVDCGDRLLPEEPILTVPPGFVCPDDGFHAVYTDRCSSVFYTCLTAGDNPYLTNCPGIGVFDPIARKCVLPDSTGCLSLISTTTLTSPTPTTASPFKCPGIDGYYPLPDAIGCVKGYYSCISGNAYLLNCPGPGVFDPIKKSCVLEGTGNCAEDFSTVTSVTDSSTLESTTSSAITTSTVTTTSAAVSTSTTVSSGFQCPPADGLYPLPGVTTCIKFYYSCQNGLAFPGSCSGTLLFDPVSRECKLPDECGSSGISSTLSTTTPTIPSTSTLLPTSTASTVTSTATSTTASTGFQCPPIDGFYPLPGVTTCIKFYYSCQGGLAFPQSCSGALVFDPVVRVCKSTEECGLGGVTSTVASTSTPSVETTVSTTDSTTITSTQPTSTPESTTTQSTTTTSTITTTTTTPTTTSTQPSTTTSTTQPSTTSRTTMAITTTKPNNIFTCPMREGIFADPFSCTQYYQCSNGIPYLIKCPSDLYYNPQILQCDWSYNVVCKPQTILVELIASGKK